MLLLTVCPSSISVTSLHVSDLSLHVSPPSPPTTGFCSHLCECRFLNTSLVFNDLFSSRVALDGQLVLHSRAEGGALPAHPASQRSSAQSSLTAYAKVTGIGFVLEQLTSLVPFQAL